MTHHGEIRGGVPVAAIDSLTETERVVVQALRHWAGGPAGAACIADLLREHMPPGAAADCQRALGGMFATIGRYGRRKLVRHQPRCPCVGADEAALAHFVTVAATGEREDAMLIGSLLVEGAMLLSFTEAARQAGLQLQRTLPAGRPPAPRPAAMRVH